MRIREINFSAKTCNPYPVKEEKVSRKALTDLE